MSSPITLQSLTKHFGTQTALNGLSLDVPAGSVFALLGENGAGKSTTVRILMGLLHADGGTARVLDLDPRIDSLEIRRRVGYVPERPTLYDWMTVDQLGWFTGGFYPAPFLQRYRCQAEQFGLPADRRIKDLSKGMRAKVSLALALAKDPALLILDEPTSGLDTLVRREFLESMLDRAVEGQTVFLSSHQIVEVERVADYVAILKQGQLVVVDRLEKLKAEITEVTLSYTSATFEPPHIPGALLSERCRARQWQAILRGSRTVSVEELRRLPGVVDVQLRTPSLEEIYVAFMTGWEPAARAASEADRRAGRPEGEPQL